MPLLGSNVVFREPPPPAPSAYADAVNARSPVGYWRLADASGSLTDETVNGNDGVDVGGITYGRPGALTESNNAVGVEAIMSKYVRVPADDTNFNITGALSISCWIKASVQGGDAGYVARWNQVQGYSYLLGKRSTGTIPTMWLRASGGSFAAYDGTGAPDVTDGSWHHIVGVYSPSTFVRVYMDGTRYGDHTTSIPASLFATATGVDLWFGNQWSTSGITGDIDEVSIHNTIFSDADVTALYNAGTT